MNELALGVDVADLRRLEAAFRAAPEMVQAELRQFMTEAVAHLQGEVQLRTPTTHGTLRGSIIGNVRPMAALGVEGEIGTGLAYAVPVELGTRPHMPPVEALIGWASQKFGLSGKEAKAAAWRVARAIAKRGTQGNFMFRDAFETNKAQVEARFAETVRRIAGRIGGLS